MRFVRAESLLSSSVRPLVAYEFNGALRTGVLDDRGPSAVRDGEHVFNRIAATVRLNRLAKGETLATHRGSSSMGITPTNMLDVAIE